MASTYSTDLKIELMVTGENAGTWGDKTNDNLNVIQQAIAGYGTQSIAGGAQTTALTIANSPTLSVARNIVIKLVGTITGNQIVTVPDGIEKTWIVSNGTTGSFTVEFKTVSGTGATWTATDKGIKILYSDGTNINTTDLSTLSGTVATASIANLAISSAKLASFAVTTARLDTSAVTGVKIAQSTITQAKLAANSVGSNQLISTGVTAGTYTSATLTVDADGRLTAASSGAAGGGDFIQVVYTSPASYTKPTGLQALKVYAIGGGGGSSGSRQPNPEGSGSASAAGGGSAGSSLEYINAPTITSTVTITVGAAGAGGSGSPGQPGQAGQPGGSSSFGGFFTAPGGGGADANGGQGAAGSVGTGGNLNNSGIAGMQNSETIKKSLTLGNYVIQSGGQAYGFGWSGNPHGGQPGYAGAAGVVVVEEYY